MNLIVFLALLNSFIFKPLPGIFIFLLNVFWWQWLIKAYRFHVCNSMIHIALYVDHPKSDLLQGKMEGIAQCRMGLCFYPILIHVRGITKLKMCSDYIKAPERASHGGYCPLSMQVSLAFLTGAVCPSWLLPMLCTCALHNIAIGLLKPPFQSRQRTRNLRKFKMPLVVLRDDWQIWEYSSWTFLSQVRTNCGLVYNLDTPVGSGWCHPPPAEPEITPLTIFFPLSLFLPLHICVCPRRACLRDPPFHFI